MSFQEGLLFLIAFIQLDVWRWLVVTIGVLAQSRVECTYYVFWLCCGLFLENDAHKASFGLRLTHQCAVSELVYRLSVGVRGTIVQKKPHSLDRSCLGKLFQADDVLMEGLIHSKRYLYLEALVVIMLRGLKIASCELYSVILSGIKCRFLIAHY